jgi:hypothetical protein
MQFTRPATHSEHGDVHLDGYGSARSRAGRQRSPEDPTSARGRDDVVGLSPGRRPIHLGQTSQPSGGLTPARTRERSR